MNFHIEPLDRQVQIQCYRNKMYYWENQKPLNSGILFSAIKCTCTPKIGTKDTIITMVIFPELSIILKNNVYSIEVHGVIYEVVHIMLTGKDICNPVSIDIQIRNKKSKKKFLHSVNVTKQHKEHFMNNYMSSWGGF